VTRELDELRKTMAAQGIASDAPVHETLGTSPSTFAQPMSGGPRASRFHEAEVAPDVEFEIRGELGRGGMATVFLANQTMLNREVAIKRASLPDDEDAELLLLREATLTGQLEHPNIVPVHLLLLDDAGPAVVMKRISGASWDSLIHAEETPLERHLDILLQVLNAVAFAHSRGVLHRDIKPSNVMIGSYGEVYLLDWGVARRAGDPPSQLIVGTPQYMAPEMASGRADERTDVFLLGATLHEVLTGSPRHLGDNALMVLYAATYVEPYAYGEHVPEELASICNRACARAPEQRFQSASELREAVLRFREHRAASLLCDTAEQRVARLVEALGMRDAQRPSYAQLQQLFGDARFRFESALDVWPDSSRAALGLDDCLRHMIDHELSLGHADAAAALLEALRTGDPARAERVRRMCEEQRAERERLATLARDRDPRVGARGRARAYQAMGLGVLLMTLALLVQRWFFANRTTSTLRLTFVGAAVFLLMSAITLRWRRRTAWNFINRRIAEISLSTLIVSFANRLSGYMLDSTPERVLISDAFILGLGGATLAAYHRAGPWLAWMSFGVAIVGSVWSDWVDELFIGLTVFVATTMLVLRRAGFVTPDDLDETRRERA
jgi:serine/threonine-protein kinase